MGVSDGIVVPMVIPRKISPVHLTPSVDNADMTREIVHVDVFCDGPFSGNPVAVVADADGLSDEQMQTFARWTNLSETTFLLPPTTDAADYRVRIFTPSTELPFAGHPTLGTCHAWLARADSDADTVVQECGAGLVTLRRDADGLAFAAPALIRSGPVDDEHLARVVDGLGLASADVVDAAWVDNGPGWMAILVSDVDTVLRLRPGNLGEDANVGVVGRYPPGSPAALEVRAFFPAGGVTVEDPVTGSLNASVAQWLVPAGRLRTPYTASQGTVIGRRGRVRVSSGDDGAIWVGGATRTCITGTVALGNP